MAMPRGFEFADSAMVFTTRSTVVSITETVSEEKLATYNFAPSGDTAQPNGSAPTDTVLATWKFKALMTETVPLPMLVTYTLRPFGVTATQRGSRPTASSLIFSWASPATR